MKALILLPSLVLAACGGEQPPNPHDSKYQHVTVDSDRCVVDTITGLTWEAKTTAPGLRNRDNTYSWFDPNEANRDLDYRGVANAGTCEDSDCDTWSYVRAVNKEGYCGFDDWRMPNKDELFSISDLTRTATPPTVNTDFFPETHAAEYWSGNDYSFQHDAAWGWNFALGHDRVDWKKTPKHVRLVRGKPAALQAVKE